MGSNILYIEDNPDNMTLVKRALEAHGYTLLQAMTGIDGVTTAEREAVDLILYRPSEQVLGMPRSCWEQPF